MHGIDDPRKRLFLAAMVASGGVLTKAAQRAGVSRQATHLWRKQDERFAEAFIEATERAGDLIETEMYRRGVEGVKKPVFYKGVRVDEGMILEYSDQLLIALAAARRPAQFGRHRGDRTTSGQTIKSYGGFNPEDV